MSETTATAADYEAAKQVVIEDLLEFLRVGEALGKSQLELAGEFMAAFQSALEEAFAA